MSEAMFVKLHELLMNNDLGEYEETIHEVRNLIAAQANEIKNLREIFEYIEEECLSIEAEDEPTGGGDYDVVWGVYSHHMSKPHKRLEGYGENPLDAVRDAMNNNN